MATVTLKQVLELTRKLPDDEQEMLVDLVRRGRIDAWRKELARDADKARKDFLAGKLKAEKVESVIARLEADWAKDESE